MAAVWPPLHTAVWEGNASDVSRLVAAGANVSVPLMDGLTPLHIAAHNGSPEIIELLLLHGASLNAKLPTGATPMYICALNGNLEAIRSFIKYFPRDKRLPSDLLHAAASGGHHDAVKLLLETRRIDVDGLVDGTSALWVASQQGHVEVVKLLVEFGVKVNLCTPDGRTPLYVAAYRGHADVCRVLLAAGADAFAENHDGGSPRHIACYENHVDTVRTFCAAGVDMLRASHRHVSPYQVALVRRKPRVERVIRFYAHWPLVRLLWVAYLKNRPPANTACPLAMLPRDMILLIAHEVIKFEIEPPLIASVSASPMFGRATPSQEAN